jgi:hypothetical protein
MRRLPNLRKVVIVPWYAFTYQEWYGERTLYMIDYNIVKGLELKRAMDG